ncbi:hypothetical protein HMPREF2534_03714 [Bacteroides thetaiotaomicron]|nr:hypothetical protein HMPREF2534_03714 [Bacteroides thetaiotaomicron]
MRKQTIRFRYGLHRFHIFLAVQSTKNRINLCNPLLEEAQSFISFMHSFEPAIRWG